MKRTGAYTDLKGRTYSLAGLDDQEWELLQELERFSIEQPDWVAYRNLWTTKVRNLLAARGLVPRERHATPLYRIAQDIGSRLAVAAGVAQPPDYRNELESLIRDNFRTRREFCEATGISEDMLSHVLAGRKHLAIDTLSQALERIGYRLQITPRP